MIEIGASENHSTSSSREGRLDAGRWTKLVTSGLRNKKILSGVIPSYN